ncbi:unnamed protein product [Cylicocyclus nassatus]|uniref:Uncharacterized protein n=1 Tax=Cylicocyclus nassatus TaxID=53992 RepID=A0AA36M3F2_CYLNA|nr:unnamed protein product [Cylicocyclus nassatus]
MNSNSSGSSGLPLNLSSHLRDSSDALSRPTWLFNSQVDFILDAFGLFADELLLSAAECARQANSYWQTLGENGQQRTKRFDSMVQARFTWNGNIRSALKEHWETCALIRSNRKRTNSFPRRCSGYRSGPGVGNTLEFDGDPLGEISAYETGGNPGGKIVREILEMGQSSKRIFSQKLLVLWKS